MQKLASSRNLKSGTDYILKRNKGSLEINERFIIL